MGGGNIKLSKVSDRKGMGGGELSLCLVEQVFQSDFFARVTARLSKTNRSRPYQPFRLSSNIKQTPKVDFTNILQAAFARKDPKRAKMTLMISLSILCLWDLHT